MTPSHKNSMLFLLLILFSFTNILFPGPLAKIHLLWQLSFFAPDMHPCECFCFIGRFFLIKQKRLSAYVSSTYAKSLVPHIWIIRHTLFVTKAHCHLTYTRHVTMRFTILRVCWLHGYNYSLLTRSSYHTVFSPSRSNWVFCVKKMKSYENTKPAMLPPAYWHPRS